MWKKKSKKFKFFSCYQRFLIWAWMSIHLYQELETAYNFNNSLVFGSHSSYNYPSPVLVGGNAFFVHQWHCMCCVQLPLCILSSCEAHWEQGNECSSHIKRKPKVSRDKIEAKKVKRGKMYSLSLVLILGQYMVASVELSNYTSLMGQVSVLLPQALRIWSLVQLSLNIFFYFFFFTQVKKSSVKTSIFYNKYPISNSSCESAETKKTFLRVSPLF